MTRPLLKQSLKPSDEERWENRATLLFTHNPGKGGLVTSQTEDFSCM
jgi:hypothetical protein